MIIPGRRQGEGSCWNCYWYLCKPCLPSIRPNPTLHAELEQGAPEPAGDTGGILELHPGEIFRPTTSRTQVNKYSENVSVLLSLGQIYLKSESWRPF